MVTGYKRDVVCVRDIVRKERGMVIKVYVVFIGWRRDVSHCNAMKTSRLSGWEEIYWFVL